MKALVYHKQNDLRFHTDFEEPKINSPDELLVEVSYCGICGSDLKEYKSEPNFFSAEGGPNKLTGLKAPLPMGHEIAGTIIEVGEAVKDLKAGDHVVIEPSVFCEDVQRFPESPLQKSPSGHEPCVPCTKGLTNICRYSSLSGLGAQGGGLADYFVTSERHAIKIPSTIPLEVAALVQPIAVSWHALRISAFKENSSCLVLGAGAVGLAAVISAVGHKASKIVCSEPSKARRENAEKLGAVGFDPSGIEDPTEELLKLSPGGLGYDFTYDCSGFESTLLTAIRAAVTNGTAVNVAIWGKDPIRFWPMDITRPEKKLMGSMCYTRLDFEQVLDAIEKGHIDLELARTMITSVVDLENGIEGGFNHLMNNKATEIKVLLTPNNHGEIENAKTFTKTHHDYLQKK